MAARDCIRVAEFRRHSAPKGSKYKKVIGSHGSPFPFLRKGSREQLREATGSTKLPTLKLPDGTVITNSRAIFRWTDHRSNHPEHYAEVTHSPQSRRR